jgi:hypothetical protein
MLWNAIRRTDNRQWTMDFQPNIRRLLANESLYLIYKISSIASIEACQAVLDKVNAKGPAEGFVSPRTGEEFTCRIWVKDALLALDKAGVIELAMSVGGKMTTHQRSLSDSLPRPD